LPFIKHTTVKNIEIDPGEEVPAQLDGELIKANLFEIEVLPGKFLFKF
jgi:diacylglycerol kinase family enzyme